MPQQVGFCTDPVDFSTLTLVSGGEYNRASFGYVRLGDAATAAEWSFAPQVTGTLLLAFASDESPARDPFETLSVYVDGNLTHTIDHNEMKERLVQRKKARDDLSLPEISAIKPIALPPQDVNNWGFNSINRQRQLYPRAARRRAARASPA